MLKHCKISTIALFAILSCCGQALAHAHLDSSVPADNEAVAMSPSELDMHFSEELNVKFSGAKVTGTEGVPVGSGQASLGDAGKTLIVPLSAKLDAGVYKVEWHVLSTDGHKTSGSFSFTVKP